jgi:hypothetical protein
MYRYEFLEFEDVMFTTIKTTVVLTMYNSQRRTHYMEQIHKFKPTKQVIIQHNPGFLNKIDVDSVAKDILHALINASFLVDNGPLLVLEDDVRFLPRIFNHINNIETFINDNKDWDVYALGAHPLKSERGFNTHVRVFKMGGSHAWIYSNSGLELLKSSNTRERIHTDLETKSRFNTHEVLLSTLARSYMYNIPLAVQPHPFTNSAERWMSLPRKLFIISVNGHRNGELLYRLSHMTSVVGGIESIVGSTDCHEHLNNKNTFGSSSRYNIIKNLSLNLDTKLIRGCGKYRKFPYS